MEWKSPHPGLTDHVVICNCNAQIRRVVEELHAENVDDRPDVVLLIQDRELWDDNPAWHPAAANPYTAEHFFVLFRERRSSPSEALREARVSRARAVVILADPHHGDMADARSTLVAVAIERENPQVHTVMELIRSVNRAHLRATEVNEVVCRGEIAEKLIAQSCITPGVKNIFWSLLTNAPGTNNIYLAPTPSEAVGSTYREVARRLIEARAPMVLIGFVRVRDDAAAECVERDSRASITSSDTEAGVVYVINPRRGREPGRDSVLRADDQLVFISNKPPCMGRHLA